MDVSLWVRFTATERRERDAAHRVLIEPSLDDPCTAREVAHLDACVDGAIEMQTGTTDITDYLKQGGQTAGHRELWRLLRTLFKDTDDTDKLID